MTKTVDRDIQAAKRAARQRRSSGRVAAGFLGALASGLVAMPALAQSIIVQGNTRTDAETIRSYLQLGQGESYTSARIDRGIKDLIDTGMFSDVKISRQGNGVLVRVVENNTIGRVAFEGNSKLKADVLQGEVQSRSRGPFSQALVDNDVQRLREVYRRSGRGEAQINARKEAEKTGGPMPPEPQKPDRDKPFILDPLL